MITTFLFSAVLVACYSFTGASIAPHLSTVAIPLVDDRSGFGAPGLRELLTQQLTEEFITDNSLQVADRTEADSILEGIIVRVTDAASVLGQGESVDTRRVTIEAKFVYKDMTLRKDVWERTFSNWGDYETTGGDIFQAQQGGLQEAIRKISEDVLLQTVSGW
ncbi:MAG: LPS assembly lipoprotein LptE [Ignavibacteria bacterium]|nr:LPS assembly lipoprotein LptE [Ignavibacteria bacterium]